MPKDDLATAMRTSCGKGMFALGAKKQEAQPESKSTVPKSDVL